MTQPGVLGYASLPLAGPGLEAALEELLGYRVRGLGDTSPVVLVPLDVSALGGGLALMVPVADEELFRATLELWEGFERVGPDRYRLTPGPGSGLSMAISALGAASTSGAAMGWLSGRGLAAPRPFTLHMIVEDDRCIVAPTFEALGACRTLQRRVPGLSEGWREAAVVSLDVGRARLAWAPQIARARAQLMSTVSTLAMMAGAESDAPPRSAEFSRWVGAILDQLHSRDLEAGQARLGLAVGRRFGDGALSPDDMLAGSAAGLDLLGLDGSCELDLLVAEGTALHDMLTALEPAPDVPDALFVETVGPEAMAAFARWLEPFRAALSPQEQAGLDALLPAVAAFAGTIAVVGSPAAEPDGWRPVVLVSPSVGGDVDWDDTLQRWVSMLDAAAESWGEQGPRFTVAAGSGGRVELRAEADGGSDVLLSAGTRAGVAWIAPGPGSVAPGACEAFAAALDDVHDDAPVLRLHLPLDGSDVRGEARVDGAWLRWTLRLEGQP